MGARTFGGSRRRGLSMPSRPRLPSLRSVRRWLLILVVAAIVIGCAYMFWLRDSSLVAIERVTVTGAEGDPSVQSALTVAAEEMTTLHVDQAALEAAVANDPSVLSIETSTDFPHGLTIAVDSRRPAGYVAEGGAIVAGDGVVLEVGADQPEGLPLIDADGVAADAEGARVDGGPLALARILGAVPEPLQGVVTSAKIDEENGPVVEVGEGIELRFGDPAHAERKWQAAAVVLADPTTDSAVYVDVAVPARPVVG